MLSEREQSLYARCDDLFVNAFLNGEDWRRPFNLAYRTIVVPRAHSVSLVSRPSFVSLALLLPFGFGFGFPLVWFLVARRARSLRSPRRSNFLRCCLYTVHMQHRIFGKFIPENFPPSRRGATTQRQVTGSKHAKLDSTRYILTRFYYVCDKTFLPTYM